ncbi:protein FAM83H [Pempheris klunzingeri]|uniref:protein FAM83H n=1 Tax=Pempheris klunzingeri TaxID=3127111 RepID=UPI0039814F65
MARRSQCSSAGDNPLDPNYLPPHYREEYRLAVDALVEEDLEGYYQFLQKADVVDFLSLPEIQYIQESVQVPEQSDHPEQRFLELGEDGSSDTYWPILSDLDAPGLDLGWPQLHHFIGPTEVTTLVNPPEPDMPSIKDQARRLIKNAQQVIAIVMDMFTDVDILADILNAAMRNVAVYILLDKENVHHFVNMVSNCRVNLQSIQFLRVRTVSGITYHCRSGKSFKGQMMDRFLLTDCRAVLSGNYSFMWSFEKLHRCMAHLFLGQLVSTFDEEFRILFAQSQPLIIENVPAPVDDFSISQKRQYPSERPSLYREQRKFLSLDTAHPDEWARYSYDEPTEMDWRMMPLKKQESLHGPADMYSRFPSQQSRMDPCFDQGPSRMQMMENPAFKRHSYAEGIHGRYSYPFLQQQGMPEPDSQGRQFHRGPQPYPGPGPEADYGGYEKFWNQDFQSADQCSEPGLPPEMEPPDNFDPVLNYLSTARNVDVEQGSNRLPPPADLPFSSSHPKRLTLGQPYTYETSPTPSNPTDQKQFFQEPNTSRKDPMVKQGLRNWRISSYLSAYDNPGDEGLPLAPPNAPDPFEEPSNPTQQTAPGIDLSAPKIPNVREFKIPAIPRASQMPSYAKTTAREQPRKLPDEPTAVAPETKTTPTSSESSSTNEREKTDEAEQKEPKTAVIQREESFRRKYNAAVQRSSRLRSSLIFSSLEQQHTSHDTKTAPGQQDGESDKNEAEQTKLPFVSQVLGQRRSTAKEPVEWSRYIRSATFDSSATGSSKPDDGSTKADDKDPSKDKNPQGLPGNPEVQESSKPQNIEQGNSSPSIPRSKPSEAELPKINEPVQPPISLFTTAYVDMSDPDNRLMFFKELAAKRRAAKAEEAEKSKETIKPTTELKNNTTVKKEKTEPRENVADTSTSKGLSEKSATTKDAGKTVSTEMCHSVSQPLDASDKTNKEDSQVRNDINTPQSCKKEQTRVSTDSEKIQLKNIQTATTLRVSEEAEAPQSKPPEEPKLSNPAVKKSSSCHPPTPTSATPANVPSLAQGTDKSESPCLDSTSKESRSLSQSSVEVSPTSAVASLDSVIQNPESVQLETSIPCPPLLSEQRSGSEFSSSNPPVQSSSDHILPESGSPSCSAPVQTIFSNENSSSSLTASILSPKTAPQRPQSTEKKISPSAPDPFQKPTSPIVSNPSQSAEKTISPSAPEPSRKPARPLASNPSQSVEKTVSPSTLDPSQKPASPSGPESSKSAGKTISPLAPKPSKKPASPSASEPSQSSEKSVSHSAPEPSQLVEETSQKSTAPRISQTESESTQTHLDSVSQVMSSKTSSSVHSTRVESDISPDTYAADTSSLQPITTTDFGESGALEKDVSESENDSILKADGEECEVLESSKDVKPDGTTSSPSSSSAGSCLLKESALESKSRSDHNKTISPTLSPADCPPKHSPAETSIPVQPVFSLNASQLGTTASSQDVPIQATTSSELNLTGSVTPTAAETVSRSTPLTETAGSVLFPEADKTDTNSPPKQITTVSNKASMLQSTETYSPTEPTSKVPTEPDLPCKTPQSVTSETHPSDPPVPAEGTNMGSPNNASKEMPESDEKKTDDTEATNKVNETTTQGSTCSEKASDQVRQNNCSDLPEITSDGIIPPSQQSKLPKSSQSRYHSSTANVLSSSNLRDDTKLLLEQISANSQSRSEATKEAPVTDDEKEDEADKHAKRETERGTNESPVTDDEKEDKADKKARSVKDGEIRSLSRVQPKSNQERDKLLERIQSMRKERKVYSRFEV